RRKGLRIQIPHSAKSEADQSTARGETPKISFALGGLSYSGRSECWGSTVWPNATALPSPSRACVLPRLKAAGRLQVPDAAFGRRAIGPTVRAIWTRRVRPRDETQVIAG